MTARLIHGRERFRLFALAVLAIAAMLVVMAGCGGEEAKSTPGASTGEQAAATPILKPTREPLSAADRFPHIGYGMNVQLYYTDYDRVLNLVKDAGFGWVKQQVTWKDTEGPKGAFGWDELDRVVGAANDHGINIILSVVKSPAWATADGGQGLPKNPQDFGDFMKVMAARYKGRVAAYELWNEENMAGEFGGEVDAGRYVKLLKAGYEAVKAEDLDAVVISGGLTPTGVNDPKIAVDDAVFLEQLYQYNGGEFGKYFDVLGAHPGGNNNPPDSFWPDNPGPDGWSDHQSFYFRRVEDLRKVMEKYGDGKKQVWLTEFGWTTKNEAPGYEYGKDVTDELQAQYLVRAYEKAKADYPWMGVMSLWNLNFSTVVPPTDEKYPWSIINGDWSPRPAYEALKKMPK